MKPKKYSGREALFIGAFLLMIYIALHDTYILDRIPHHLGLVILNLIPLVLVFKLLAFTWKFIKDLFKDIFNF